MVVPQARAAVVVGHLNNSGFIENTPSKREEIRGESKVSLSIVIPVLNEAKSIETCLSALQPLRDQNLSNQDVEIILVDGGSEDSTCELAASFVDHVITSKPGRGIQLNTGAAIAQGKHLLFLHSDTVLPSGFSPMLISGAQWGFFPVKLSGLAWPFRVIERAMNLRSKITKIATGDQAIFIQSEYFQRVGGFAEIPLMEDVEICGRLKSEAHPLFMPSHVVTSSRRWEQQGIVRTILRMWRLRLAFFFGACPHRLVQQYYP